MPAPAAALTQPAAPRRPRLLQREAARRHGLYARLHLFNAEETRALRAEIRDLFESMNPRGPVAVGLVSPLALASFQLRRAFGLDPQFLARNPRDITAVVRLVLAIGAFESQYSRLLYDAIARLDILDQQAAERIALESKSGKRTPELIEEKENAPERQVNPTRLQRRARPTLEFRTGKSYYFVWISRSEDPASAGRGRVSC